MADLTWEEMTFREMTDLWWETMADLSWEEMAQLSWEDFFQFFKFLINLLARGNNETLHMLDIKDFKEINFFD